MPVIVVGADSSGGPEIIDAVTPRDREVRVFVTDDAAAAGFRAKGTKVALGDVSDGSHVGSAAINAFCAVVLAEAATDDRIRSFADTPQQVLDGWAEGLADAGVQRVIFVQGGGIETPGDALETCSPEYVSVAGSDPEGATLAARVAAIEEAESVVF